MTKQLIINADDFGISKGVSEGIVEAHLNGVLTSTSLMAHMPAAQEAINMAHDKAPNLGVGLHITFSFGAPASPVSEVPSLIYADNKFASNWDEVMTSAGRFSLEEVKREVFAQFNRYLEVAGHKPDHLDGHHGFAYMHPAAFEAMLQLAKEHNLPIRNDIIYPPDALLKSMNTTGEALMKELQRLYDANPARQPNRFIPEPDFYNGGATLETMLTIIPTVPEGISEIGCHPGHPYDLDELYKDPRERELQILLDPRVREAIDRAGVELVSFSQV